MGNLGCFNMGHEQGKQRDEKTATINICIRMNKSFAEVAR